MTKFNYVAMDTKGREITGVLEGDDTNNALRRIHETGYFPTSVTRVRSLHHEPPNHGTNCIPRRVGGHGLQQRRCRPRALTRRAVRAIPGLTFSQSNKVKSKVLTAFTRQLATLIDAGLPLLQGVEVLREQEKNPVLRRTLARVAETVEAGSTFSEALAEHPRIFNKLYVNMVRAGETGGMLDIALKRLAEFQEKAQKIKGKVIAAMVYPAVVISVALMILVLLMVKVVPRFQEIFRELMGGRPLPWLTNLVVDASRLVQHRFVLLACLAIGLVMAVKMVGNTVKGRYAIDTMKLHAPVFGQLVRKVGIARFARTLGTLVSSGVPILQALTIVRETAGNAVIARAVTRVHDSVKEGEQIVQPLKASKVFPPVVISMVDVGERTGALPDMLIKVADVYDEEVDNAVGALTSLLEPLMIVVLAVVVGTIVIAMFLPLLDIIIHSSQ